jgi:tRNA(Ile2) C34 agmatinyltransferase TiaS
VAIGASKSKFSSAVTGDRITVAGQVKNKAPFLTRVGAFDVDLALEVGPQQKCRTCRWLLWFRLPRG